MAIHIDKNQLQFNLDVPASHQNIAARFHRPKPLILDRGGIAPPGIFFGDGHGQVHVGYEQSTLNASGMSFTSLSEDKITNAVKLAKRDLKKKREQEMRESCPKGSKSSRAGKRDISPKFGRSRTKTKIVHGKEYWDRLKKQQEKSQHMLRVREVGKSGITRNAHSISPTDKRSRNEGVSEYDPYFPVRSNSPPVKDTDFKLNPVKHSAPCEQPSKEIERLQREMEEYLQQIQVIEQRAINEQNIEFLHQNRGKKEGFLDKEEDRKRKQTRAEELTTRTNRQLYMLRHQIREIQNELLRVGPEKIKHTKKSRTYSRLAQAHRGAVRTIQAFVTNLPNTDLSSGLPGTYHELALLIRQMSLISSQLAAGENSSAQADLMKMLDRVDELNKEWGKDAVEPAVEASTEEKRQRSPPRPPFDVNPTFVSKQPPQPRLFPKGKENKPKGVLHVRPNLAKSHGVKKPVKQEAQHIDHERKAALRAGISALVREGQIKKTQPNMARELPTRAPPVAAEKSLILPKKLQEKRARAQKANQPAMTDCHFADPTIAFALKAHSPPRNPIRPERSFSAPPTPSSERKKRGRSPSMEPWVPGGILKKSPAAKRRSRSFSPQGKRLNLLQNFLDGSTSDVAKTLFFDDSHLQSQNSTPHDRKSRPRTKRALSPSDQKRLKSKPLFKTEEFEDFPENLNPEFSEENDYAQKGDKLTESILEDVLNDTAEELERLEIQEKSHRRALALQDNPTLENLVQRLSEMEEEQVNIRKRWATVHFAEVEKKNNKKHDIKPQAPAAFTITRHAAEPRQFQMNLTHEPETSDEPIIFTKSKPVVRFEQQGFPLEFNEPMCDRAYSTAAPPPTQVTVPQRELDSIFLYQDRFSRFLKKSSHHVSGRFNPWKLMEELADQILEECYAEIVSELEDINETVVNQICKAEFTIPSSVEELPPANTFYPMVDIFEGQPVQMSLSGTPPSILEEMIVKNVPEETNVQADGVLTKLDDVPLNRQVSIEQMSQVHSQWSRVSVSENNDDTYDDEFEEVTAEDDEDDDYDYEDEDDDDEDETEELSEASDDRKV